MQAALPTGRPDINQGSSAHLLITVMVTALAAFQVLVKQISALGQPAWEWEGGIGRRGWMAAVHISFGFSWNRHQSSPLRLNCNLPFTTRKLHALFVKVGLPKEL